MKASVLMMEVFMLTKTNKSLVESIPSAERVRNRLAEILREARLLKELLRVAERAAKSQLQENRNGGDSQ